MSKKENLDYLVEKQIITDRAKFEDCSTEQITDLINSSIEREKAYQDKLDEISEKGCDAIILEKNKELVIEARKANQLAMKIKEQGRVKIKELAKLFN